MRTNKQIEKQASDIADAIVELVERANGPVTLGEVDRKIPGFVAKEPPSWQYFYEHDDGREVVFWGGMTEAGVEALRKVLRGHRVAIQFVNPVLYFVENCLLDDDRWLAIVLLPARAANVETPAYLERRMILSSEQPPKDWLATGCLHQVLRVTRIASRCRDAEWRQKAPCCPL